jgi:hypothetical protein
MSEKHEKLLIRIGSSFEANASGRLAIIVVMIIACVMIYFTSK